MNSTQKLREELYREVLDKENLRFITELKNRNTLLACAATGIAPSEIQIAEIRALYSQCVDAGMTEYLLPLKQANNILNAKK